MIRSKYLNLGQAAVLIWLIAEVSLAASLPVGRLIGLEASLLTPMGGTHESSAAESNELPYKNGMLMLPSTIGQLTKQSDLIVVGTIIQVASAQEHRLGEKLLEVQINEVLLGSCKSNSLWLPCSITEMQSTLPTNVQVLVYVSQTDYWPPEAFAWSFDKQYAKKAGDLGMMVVMKGSRGVIPSSTSMVSVARGYISHLRGAGDRDAVSYVSFLQSLKLSGDVRIRDDARDDLLLVLHYGGDDIVGSVTKNGGLDEEMLHAAAQFQRLKNDGTNRMTLPTVKR